MPLGFLVIGKLSIKKVLVATYRFLNKLEQQLSNLEVAGSTLDVCCSGLLS